MQSNTVNSQLLQEILRNQEKMMEAQVSWASKQEAFNRQIWEKMLAQERDLGFLRKNVSTLHYKVTKHKPVHVEESFNSNFLTPLSNTRKQKTKKQKGSPEQQKIPQFSTPNSSSSIHNQGNTQRVSKGFLSQRKEES